MKYLFEKSIKNDDGTVTIPADQVERWERQMETPYDELSEDEKESDREQARKYVAEIDSKEKPGSQHSLDMHDEGDGSW